MLDSSGPRNVGNVDQAVNAVLNLDESPEVSQVSHSTMDTGTHLITFMKRLPGIILNLLHTEADATRLRINAQHFYFDIVSGIHELAGMFHTFRPAHF